MTPLQVLFDESQGAQIPLPEELAEAYGGPFQLPETVFYTNFVETIDGVVALPEVERSNALIAAGSDNDRLLMGLLRATADVVVIGSGTLAGSPKALWKPSGAYPGCADSFAALRTRLGLALEPEVAVVTGSGAIDLAHPLLESGALVLTTEAGAERLVGALPSASSVLALGSGGLVEAAPLVEALQARGHQRILSEAGPHLFGALLSAGVVDELFLTVSPLLAGRALTPRFGLVEGAELLPDRAVESRLLSARRDGRHLFLRYAVGEGVRA